MYKIVGADRREYGPVGADQLRDWIAQGRANAQTVARFEEGPWKPLSTFPEFAELFAAAPPPGVPPPLGQSPTPPAQSPQTIYLPPPAQPQTNNMAVAGLVFGILGLWCCPLIGSVFALIFSGIGLNQINQNPGRYKTDKLVAIIGLALGVLGLAMAFSKGGWSFRPGRWRWFQHF